MHKHRSTQVLIDPCTQFVDETNHGITIALHRLITPMVLSMFVGELVTREGDC